MSLPPKIVHIIYSLGTGGLENGLVNIINRSPPERYRHAIVCLTDATGFAKRITVPGVDVIQLHKKPGHDWGLYFRLLKVLFSLKPDIVHTRNLTSLEMQALTLLLPGVKRVHGEHGRDVNDLDGTNKKYNYLRKLLRFFIHRYITVSKDLEHWLKEIINVPELKVRQIYNGVDTEHFYPASTKKIEFVPDGFISTDSIVIGAVGRLAEVKNHRALILAVDQILNKKPELAEKLKVIIVGDGPLLEELKALVTKLNLAGSIWLPGDRSDIPQFLRLMDVFVLPSLAEGISNTVLEAMATGLPIVATRIGGNPELVEDAYNGRLVAVDSHEELAVVLNELIEDLAGAKKMGQRGLARIIETFSWDETVAEYLAVYDVVLGMTHLDSKEKGEL